ncbi:MAG: PilN domain-containing protein, partial [Gammaproteobacteria bacterium]|jgi:type IV pilus assembly protein PilN|nr:pilus assembly protein PilN [Chromatiales bacterium]MDP6415881.1 PilN domain-containing protein [Gammaproteobacteria bacterium]MDP6673361.1 PilN domain-containing protein [Gammaproteobacteria bacterium]
MPRINLLPWRDEQRTERRNQFFIALGAAALAAASIILIGNLTFGSIIGHQQDRNRMLQSEIDLLNIKIKEIIDLEDQKDRLLARMEIIEQLQRSRPGIVHVFEELVTTLPNGVFLNEVKQNGSRIEIVGSAESNTRVSALMRNIDGSDWLSSPDLEVVEVKPGAEGSGRRASEFTVFAESLTAKKGEEQEVEEGSE